MKTENYKDTPYTIQTSFETGTVWLNNHLTKEKLVLTEEDAASIARSFEIMKNERERLA